MDKQRWTYYAMYEHIQNNSYYYKHINKIRNELNFTNYISKHEMGKHINTHFLKKINNIILQHQLPINELDKLKLHKQCRENCTIISNFRLKREYTLNYNRISDQSNECIPCWLNGIHKINTGLHIFF